MPVIFVVLVVLGIRDGTMAPKEAIGWSVAFLIFWGGGYLLPAYDVLFAACTGFVLLFLFVRLYGKNLISHY